MSILILAPDDDLHAQAVMGHLRAAGQDADIVDLSTFPVSSYLDVSYGGGGGHEFGLTAGGRRIDLGTVGAAWWRRPRSPDPSSVVGSPRHQLFAANECQEALSGLWHALDVFWINDPAKDHIAHRKLLQLRTAQEVGLTIPETVVTNDPDRARAFIDSRDPEPVAYKAFSALEDEWRETRLLKEEELTLLDNVAFAPVIFQEYIDASYDVRLTVVGDELFPAAIHAHETSYPIDCRMDIASARIEAIDLPDEVATGIRRLMERLGLVYGAIDLRRRASDGEFVFLEINPAGQWLFIEERTGQPIARAMAAMLARHDSVRDCEKLAALSRG